MDEKTVGARIKRLRNQRAWTQERLADVAEISVRTVQRAEEGVMSAETVHALAAAFDEPTEALLQKEPGYPHITPILYYDDPASLDWLVEVFGCGTRMKIPGPDGRIVHAELTFGDGLIMVGVPIAQRNTRTPRQLDGTSTMGVYAYVADVDAHFEHVKQAGAVIVEELQDMHGQRRYQAEDPEGHRWWFFSPLD